MDWVFIKLTFIVSTFMLTAACLLQSLRLELREGAAFLTLRAGVMGRRGVSNTEGWSYGKARRF